ncbi:MAG: COX15/CtaA family protein [Nitrososphaerota archaeon]|nr:COX15/CtaA family protein [Candidatus Calditenuaceae archaeon]MDW8072649.1 COX15/CtaA family protein [Nitrososphaerota archaeon]
MNSALKLFQSTVIASASIIVMNVIGSYVSAIGAGMACPDWPLCPFPENYLVLMEFLHRVWGLVVIGAIALTVLRARSLENLRELRLAKLLVNMSLLVVLIQVGLGAVVVFSGLRPEFVATHQLLAQLTLSLQVFASGLSWVAAGRLVEVGEARRSTQ